MNIFLFDCSTYLATFYEKIKFNDLRLKSCYNSVWEEDFFLPVINENLYYGKVKSSNGKS